MVISADTNKPVLRIKCRSRRGASAELEVLDISIGGAMVQAQGWSAEIGDRVLITLPGLSAQPAELVWIEDGRAGLTFEQPLHETIYDKFSALVSD
ncbi:PilZ domain-containing protein [Aurantiacibacter aquimixticola]|uniref:PilZ domain-containing protein n=1 Tax=Aurantiacibacter aquimixticola TaxID=1958945 RepID=A0A419RTT2_9SPHN|nr:PilZ domain-containing protein [Aurantiacibacter aquimixticola]RJY09197.1 PilZ domain-containing protein [Aurantiacibacter aquimixticola]